VKPLRCKQVEQKSRPGRFNHRSGRSAPRHARSSYRPARRRSSRRRTSARSIATTVHAGRKKACGNVVGAPRGPDVIGRSAVGLPVDRGTAAPTSRRRPVGGAPDSTGEDCSQCFPTALCVRRPAALLRGAECPSQCLRPSTRPVLKNGPRSLTALTRMR